MHASHPQSAFLQTEAARGACTPRLESFSHQQWHRSPTESDSPWPQRWIAHLLCCVLFIFRYCSPVCFATLMQKKKSMPSTRTRWRCSTRRCPLRPTLSCFTPHGEWTISYQVCFFLSTQRWMNCLAVRFVFLQHLPPMYAENGIKMAVTVGLELTGKLANKLFSREAS